MAYFDRSIFPVLSEFTKLTNAQQRDVILENKKNGFGAAVEMVQRLSACGYTTRKTEATGSASN
jgi:hypothetical protein